jgi:hypothetical protein
VAAHDAALQILFDDAGAVAGRIFKQSEVDDAGNAGGGYNHLCSGSDCGVERLMQIRHFDVDYAFREGFLAESSSQTCAAAGWDRLIVGKRSGRGVPAENLVVEGGKSLRVGPGDFEEGDGLVHLD